MYPYAGACVSSANARTYVPMPRRFLSKPTAAFYICLSLLLVIDYCPLDLHLLTTAYTSSSPRISTTKQRASTSTPTRRPAASRKPRMRFTRGKFSPDLRLALIVWTMPLQPQKPTNTEPRLSSSNEKAFIAGLPAKPTPYVRPTQAFIFPKTFCSAPSKL